MENWQREYLVTNRHALINLTRCSTNLLSLIRPHGLLDSDDLDLLDTILKKDGERKQCDKFYDILSTRTGAYKVLVEKLHETRQTGAGKLLLDGYKKNGKPIPFDVNKPPFTWKEGESQEVLLLSKTVHVQGNAVTLLDFLNKSQSNSFSKLLNDHLDRETRSRIMTQESDFVLVPDKIPSNVNNQLYISRSLLRRIRLGREVLTAKCSDIFVINGIARSELSRLVYPNITSTSEEQLMRSEADINVRFICLEGNNNNDFERICKKANGKNVHLLEWVNNGLNWRRTVGNISTLKQYIDDNQESMDQGNFIKYMQDNSKSHICLAGTAGMGKSTFLQNLARKQKTKYKDRLVFFLDLQEFLQPLVKETKAITAETVKHLLATQSTNCTFGYQVLLHILNNPEEQFDLFFDGFDEILQSQIEFSEKVFKIITSEIPNIRLAVATRPHMFEHLENLLGVFGFNIAPLQEDDQVKLLVKFWKSKKENESLNPKKLEEYAIECIKAAKKDNNAENQNNTGEPLQCTFLGEINSENAYRDQSTGPGAKKIVHVSSKFEMFKQLIDQRMKRLSGDMSEASRSTETVDQDWAKTVKQVHILAAFDLIFPQFTEQVTQILQLNYRHFLTSREILALGILEADASSSGGVKFGHRTFAEFLLAEFLVDMLVSEEYEIESNEEFCKSFLKFLFEEVLGNNVQMEHVLQHKVGDISTETFMWGFVNQELNYFLNEQLIKRNIDQGKLEAIFHKIGSAVEEPSTHCLFASCVKTSLKKVSELVINLSNTISNSAEITVPVDAFIAAAKYSNQDYNMYLYQLLEDAYISIKHRQNPKHITPLQMAVSRGNFDVFEVVMKTFPAEMGKYLLHFCLAGSHYDDKQTVKDKIEIIRILTENFVDINERLDDGSSPLLQPFVHIELIEHLLEQGADVNAVSNNGSTLLHCFLQRGDGTKIERNILIRILARLTKYKFIGFGDRLGFQDEPLLSLALRNAQVGTQALRYFKAGGADFSVRNDQNENYLFLAIRLFQSPECLEGLIDDCGLSPEEYNGNGDTLLHVAADVGNHDAALFLVGLERQRNALCLLNRADKNGNSPLHIAFSKSSQAHEMIQDLLIKQDPRLLEQTNFDLLSPIQFGLMHGQGLTITAERMHNLEATYGVDFQGLAPKLLDAIVSNKTLNSDLGRSEPEVQKLLHVLSQSISMDKFTTSLSSLIVEGTGKTLAEILTAQEMQQLSLRITNPSKMSLFISTWEQVSKKTNISIAKSVPVPPALYIPSTFILRSRRDETHTDDPEELSISEDELIERVSGNDLTDLCVVYSSCIGLTSILSSFANKIKMLSTLNITACVDLGELTARSIGPNISDQRKHLLEYITQSEISYEILNILLERQNSKLDILVDGFLQVPEEQIPDIERFLFKAKQQLANATFYIFSRPERYVDLGNSRRMSSYDVRPFATSDHVDFLVQLWKNMWPYSNTSNLKEIAAENLRHVKKVLGDNTERLASQIFLQNYILSQYHSTYRNDITPQEIECFKRSSFEIYRPFISQFVTEELNDQSSNDNKSYIWKAVSHIFPDITLPSSEKVGKETDNTENIADAVSRTLKLKNGMSHKFITSVIEEYCISEMFTNLLHGHGALNKNLLSNKPIMKSIYKAIFKPRSNVDVHTAQHFTSIGLENPVREIKSFVNTGIVNMINCNLSGSNSINFDKDAIMLFVDCIEPQTLYDIIQACLSQDFQNIILAVLSMIEHMSGNQRLGYKMFLDDNQKCYRVLLLSTMYSNFDMTYKLCNFFTNVLHLNWKTVLNKTPNTKMTPWHVAVKYGDLTTFEHLRPDNIKNLSDRGILHTCVSGSKTDSWSTLKAKSEIIKQLTKGSKQLLNEIWRECPPLYCNDVHVDLIKTLYLEGADINKANPVDGNNIVFKATSYMPAEQFHELVLFLINTCKAYKFFSVPNQHGKTATHQALLSVPNMKLGTLQAILDIKSIDLYTISRHGGNSIFFEDTRNQCEEVERYLHERGMEYFVLKGEADNLLDVVKTAGNARVVSSMIYSEKSTSFGCPESGYTLLHLSAIFSSPQEFEAHVNFYLRMGRKKAFTLTNSNGYTPLHLAILHMDISLDTIKLVRDAGINIWTFASNGVTILESAERHRRSHELLEALKEIEDNFNSRNREGEDENWVQEDDPSPEDLTMEIWQKELMTKIFALTAVELRCDAKLMSALESKGVIDEDDSNRIKSVSENQRKLNLLNDIVKQKPGTHYFFLAKALQESGSEAASKILIDGVPTPKFFEMKLDVMGTFRRLRELLQEDEMTQIMARLKATLGASQYIDLCELALSPNKKTKLVHDTIPESSRSYIPRLLSNRVQINPKFFKMKCDDVFVFKGMNFTELTQLANPFPCDVSSNQTLIISARFILLQHEDDWNDMRSTSRNAVHLVQFQTDSKVYYLEETFGYSKHLSQFASHSEATTNQYLSEDQLLDSRKQAKTSAVLICDSSGNGKSTLLASLARKTTRRYPNKIIGFIKLPHFLNGSTNFSMETKANAYVAKKLLLDYVCPSPLGQEILDALLERGKIHMELFFDGFDEVVPKLQQPAKWILTTVSTGFANTKIYVTSTQYHKHELETSLRVIAYDIAPFTRDDQIQFLTTFWREKDGLSDPIKLHALAAFCLRNLTTLLNQRGNDAPTTPILLRILAEVYTNISRQYSQSKSTDETRPEDLYQFETSIFELYQKFMNLHLGKMFQPSRLQNDGVIRVLESVTGIFEALAGDSACKSEIHDVKNFHIWTALKLNLPEFSDLFARAFNVDKNMSTFKYLRFGILHQQSIGSNESVEFTHRILAEYMVAEFFARMITDNSKYSAIPLSFRENGFKFFLQHLLSTNLTRQSFAINQETITNECTLPLHTFKHSGIVSFLNIILENQTFSSLDSTSKLQGAFVSFVKPERLYEILNVCCAANYTHIFGIIKKLLNGVKSSALKSHKAYLLAKEPDSNWEQHSRALSLVYLATKYSNETLIEEIFQLFATICQRNLVEICEIIPEDYITPLHVAVIKGDFTMVQYFATKISLENRGLIHACVEYSQSDHPATVLQKLEICRFLLSRNRDLLYKKNSKGHETDGVLTSKRIHLDLIMFLIQEGANIYSTDKTGNSIVFTAATYLSSEDYHTLVDFLLNQHNAQGLFQPGKSSHVHPLHEILRRSKTLNAETFQLVLEASGINLNDCDEKGNNLLMCAVEQKMSVEFIQQLISLGGDYTAKNARGRSVLHLAAETGNIGAVIYFIGKGIPLNEADNEGKVPLFLAAQNLEMIQCLLEEGVDIYNTDRFGNTIIHLAALGMPKVLWIRLLNYFVTNHKQVLIDFLKLANKDGLTPLHVRLYSEEALDESTMEIVLGLPDIDVNAEDSNGNNLFLLAACRNLDVKLLKMLVDRGAEFTHVNKKGEGALHLAVKETNVETVKYLVSLGSDIDQTDIQGHTALKVAAELKKRSEIYNFQDKVDTFKEIMKILEREN